METACAAVQWTAGLQGHTGPAEQVCSSDSNLCAAHAVPAVHAAVQWSLQKEAAAAGAPQGLLAVVAAEHAVSHAEHAAPAVSHAVDAVLLWRLTGGACWHLLCGAASASSPCQRRSCNTKNAYNIQM